MAIFSLRDGPEEKVEEVETTFTIKPLVLPAIPMTLKVAWKNNRTKLEKAGMFDHFCWLQDATRTAYSDQVLQFITTYDSDTATAMVDGRTIDCGLDTIARLLWLPKEGMTLDSMPALTKKQYENIFEGEIVRSPRGCPLNKAKHHWRPWLRFVNDYLVFRPQKDMMTQKIIMAAVYTWEGKQINWARVVQEKMGEEIRIRHQGPPRTLELFSAFYITVLCKAPPTLKEVCTPSTSTPSPSPSTSPGEMEGLREENQSLRAKVANLKQTLQEKREALVTSQTTMVKHILDLAEALKEKMDQQSKLEESKRAIDIFTKQLATAEAEKAALLVQLAEHKGEREQLADCQVALKGLNLENAQLKEKLREQEAELARQLSVITQPSTVPPSMTSTVSNPVNSPPLTSDCVAELWNWEARGPAAKSLWQMFEIQCQLFFIVTGLKGKEWLDHSRFQKLWQQSVEWGVENLLVEILVRKRLNLSDPYSAFVVIGDVGARVLLYYAALEHQWVLRHQFPVNAERREVSVFEYGTQVNSQFYSQAWENLRPWSDTLKKLLAQLRYPDFVSDVLVANNQRLSFCPSVDFSGSHYIYQFDRVVNRLERYLADVSVQKRPLLNLQGQVHFDLPPENYVSVYPTIDLPVIGSPLTLKYLGQYALMFDKPEEEPVPTWSAIAWLLEDYGLSRTEDVPADIQYRRMSRQWPTIPPAAVRSHPHYCPCPRRQKWNPAATLASVEYNWPIISGPKSTAAECQATYRQFFQLHAHHKDPVCFRAAVFANVLSNWCGQWNMTIDVNQYQESHHEFLLLLKLQYRPTRWVRIVEAMAITHFIAGAHKCLINEFPNTRAGPLERFLRWQRMNAPELVARDEDLQKAIEKMEGRELKRAAADPVHQFGPAPKLLRR